MYCQVMDTALDHVTLWCHKMLEGKQEEYALKINAVLVG